MRAYPKCGPAGMLLGFAAFLEMATRPDVVVVY